MSVQVTTAGGGNIEVWLDCSDLMALLNRMGKQLTPAKFDTLMKRTMRDVGNRSKPIIRREVQAQYYAPSGEVNKAIHRAQVEGGGGNVRCRIPVVGAQGGVGSFFSASGGAYGWNPPAYRITSNIVKSGPSNLPPVMSHQGGQPPFRNIGERTNYKKNPARKLKKPVVEKRANYPIGNGKGSGLVFTRAGKSRLPIERVSAIAIPQMPANRSWPAIEQDLSDLGIKRAEHYFSRIFD